jgi:hypothetical protein
MVKADFRLAALAMTGMLAAGAANAQEVINRGSAYTVTWSNSTFANASALYGAWYGLGQSTFSDSTFDISIVSNAQSFKYLQGGGVTIDSPAPSSPYPATTTAVYSSDGCAGSCYWGWQYKTAAASGQPLSFGVLGGLPTLHFDVGGSDIGPYSPGIGYYVFVTLPGDWTTQGTSTGDYIFNSVGSGFSVPTFTYSDGITTVESFDLNFTSGSPDLNFTLVGSAVQDLKVTLVSSAVPESSTWAMMLLGFASLGFAASRKARKKSVAITA